MDDQRFDDFARKLAATPTRRGLLKALAGGAASLLAIRRPAESTAQTTCRMEAQACHLAALEESRQAQRDCYNRFQVPVNARPLDRLRILQARNNCLATASASALQKHIACFNLRDSERLCGQGCCSVDRSCCRGVCCAAGVTCGADGTCDPCGRNRKPCRGGCIALDACCTDADCPADHACTSGACEPVCPAGQTDCGGGCVDTGSDPNHCGGCNLPCPGGEVCASGACTCASGLKRCGNDCIDAGACCTDTDCPDNHSCVDGTCEPVCPAGQTDCGGECVDTSTDPDHCGGCSGSGGTVCDANQCETCQGGACVSTCPADHICDGGTCRCPDGERRCGDACCVNTQICCDDTICCPPDVAFCDAINGGCCPPERTCEGTCCPFGETCTGGVCCPEAQVCNGVCCDAGVPCIAGQCTQQRTANVRVYANNAAWTSTGLTVATGEQIAVTATGTAGYCAPTRCQSGPDGGGYLPNNCGDITCGALAGRIGGGTPFQVGSSYNAPAHANGLFELRYTDGRDSAYYNNPGHYDASITIG